MDAYVLPIGGRRARVIGLVWLTPQNTDVPDDDVLCQEPFVVPSRRSFR